MRIIFRVELVANNGFPLPSKLEFVPSESGSYQFASVNPHYFNPFECDGSFKKIDSKLSSEGLAEAITEKLQGLTTNQPSNERQQQSKAPQKRQLTPLYSDPPSKKQKIEESSHVVKQIEDRCNECQLDSKYRN